MDFQKKWDDFTKEKINRYICSNVKHMSYADRLFKDNPFYFILKNLFIFLLCMTNFLLLGNDVKRNDTIWNG